MPLEIPLRSTLPDFELQVSLEDVTYTLGFRWNQRAPGWFLDIMDEQGRTMIRAGLRLVADFPLDLYSATRQPPGMLLAYDTSGKGIDPGAMVTVADDGRSTFSSDLGARVRLFYFTTAELA